MVEGRAYPRDSVNLVVVEVAAAALRGRRWRFLLLVLLAEEAKLHGGGHCRPATDMPEKGVGWVGSWRRG